MRKTIEAEKQKDATQMKALLMESNASREKSKAAEETCQLRRRQGTGLIRVYLVRVIQVLQNVV